MARGNFGRIDVNFMELEDFGKRLAKLPRGERDKMMSSTTESLMHRFDRRVKQITPVQSGALRRGWRMDPVRKVGNKWIGTNRNRVFYAPYVEEGHRTADHKSWVLGKFFMADTAASIAEDAKEIVSKAASDYLKGVFGSD